MQIEVKYSGLEDREAKVRKNEARGLRMLSDTFDNPNWKNGDPIEGTMIFTDEPAVAIPSKPQIDMVAEIKDLKVRIEKLEAESHATV